MKIWPVCKNVQTFPDNNVLERKFFEGKIVDDKKQISFLKKKLLFWKNAASVSAQASFTSCLNFVAFPLLFVRDNVKGEGHVCFTPFQGFADRNSFFNICKKTHLQFSAAAGKQFMN